MRERKTTKRLALLMGLAVLLGGTPGGHGEIRAPARAGGPVSRAMAFPSPEASRSTPDPAPSRLRPLGPNAQGFRQFVNERDGSVLVEIPGGTFEMGSTTGNGDEVPVTPVAVAAFYLARHPVTGEQFRRFTKAAGHYSSEGWERYVQEWGPRAPVASITW